MSKLKQISQEYNDILYIRTLISTYQEIASLRMRSIRDYVLQNRDYFNGLNRIYHMVISSYRNQLRSIPEKEKLKYDSKSKQVTFKKNGKSLFVFLSANTSLYGNIIFDTFKSFLNTVNAYPDAELAIVGKIGRGLFIDSRLQRAYNYFELADTLDDLENIKLLQEFVLNYENVIIFHGQFNSVISQTPANTNVTGDFKTQTDNSSTKAMKILFEPNLFKVLEYFENQIVSSSFIQTINESYLSKYASRMISLDFALNDIDKNLKKVNLNRQKIKHYVNNKKQQALISGKSLWKI